MIRVLFAVVEATAMEKIEWS